MMQTTVMRMASMIDNVLDSRGRLGGGIILAMQERRWSLSLPRWSTNWDWLRPAG